MTRDDLQRASEIIALSDEIMRKVGLMYGAPGLDKQTQIRIIDAAVALRHWCGALKIN